MLRLLVVVGALAGSAFEVVGAPQLRLTAYPADPRATVLFDGSKPLPSLPGVPPATPSTNGVLGMNPLNAGNLTRKVLVQEGGTITFRVTLLNAEDAEGDGIFDNYTVQIGLHAWNATTAIAQIPYRPGSAVASDADIISLSTTTLSFSPPSYTASFSITATDDNLPEFDEDLVVYLHSLDNVSLTPSLKYYRSGNFSVSPFGANSSPALAWGVVTIAYQDTPAGAVDETYNPETGVLTQPGANNNVNAMVLDNQPTPRTIIVGDFTAYNSTSRNRIARVLSTGANDASFTPGSGANAFIAAVAVYRSGANTDRILIGGGFSSYDGTSRGGVARLLANGALDSSFNPGSGANGSVRAVAIDANGLPLVAGEFTLFNGSSRRGVVRLLSNGTVDTAFAPGTGANGAVYAMVVQSDGQIVIGGDFTTYNDVARARIARLNTDGSLDFSFDPQGGFDNTVFALEMDSNQRVLVGGAFITAQGVSRRGVTRLTTTGAADSTFNPGIGTDDTVYAIKEIPVGLTRGILIGGLFTHFNFTHRRHVARLYADGTQDGALDTTWLDRAYNQFAGLWSMNTFVGSFASGNLTSSSSGFPVTVTQAKVEGSTVTLTTQTAHQMIPGNTVSINMGPGLPLSFLNGTNQLSAGSAGTTLIYSRPAIANTQIRLDNYSVVTVSTAPSAHFLRGMIDSVQIAGENNPAPIFDGIHTVAGTGSSTDFNYERAALKNVISYSVDSSSIATLDIPNHPFLAGEYVLIKNLDPMAVPKLLDGVRLVINAFPNSITFATTAGAAVMTLSPGATALKVEGFRIGQVTQANQIATIGTLLDHNLIEGQTVNISVGNALFDGERVVSEVNSSTSFRFSKLGDFTTVSTVSINPPACGAIKTVLPSAGTGAGTAGLQIPLTIQPGTVTLETLDQITIGGGGHGLFDDDQVVFQSSLVAGQQRLPSGLQAGTAYYVQRKNANNFSVSLTPKLFGSYGLAVTFTNAGDLETTTSHVVRKVSAQASFVTCLEVQPGAANNVLVGGKFDSAGGGSSVAGTQGASPSVILATPPLPSIAGFHFRYNWAQLKGGSEAAADSPGNMQFSSSTYSVDEYGTTFPMSTVRTNGTLGSHQVDFLITDQSAVRGADFNLASPTLGSPLSFGGTITLSVTQDSSVEGDQDALFTLANPRPTAVVLSSRGITFPAQGLTYLMLGNVLVDESYAIDPALGFIDRAIFTVVDDDFPPGTLGFEKDIYAISENQATAQISIFRLGGSFGPVTIRARTVATAELGTTTAILNTDYTGTTNTITFATGETNKTFSIPLVDDTSFDGNKVLLIQLDTPTGGAAVAANGGTTPVPPGGTMIFGRATITINDDDPANGVPSGSIDTAFAVGTGADGIVRSVAYDPVNNFVVMGGDFTSYNGISRSRLIRLNTLGGVDLTFGIGAGANNSIHAVAVQSDRRVIVGGAFTTFSGTSINRILRLNLDGIIDSSFNAGAGANATVLAIAIHPSSDPVAANRGKVVIVGDFTQVDGVNRLRVARLNANGTLDTGFDPGTGANGIVRTVAIEASSGKVFVGGDFSIFNSSSTGRRQVVKLTAAGAVDTSFSSPFAAGDTGASVNALALDGGGQLLVGGNFPTVGGAIGSPKHLVRLDPAAGSLTSPRILLAGNDPNAQVRTLSVQANGKILLAGDFTSVNGLTRNYLARVNADGTTDTDINFGSGPSARVLSLASTASRILIGGEFTTFDGIARNRVAQLLGGNISADLNGFVQFSAATYTADEDAGSVGILVKRTSGLQGAVSFSFRTADPVVTFNAGSDQVTFPGGNHGLAVGRIVRFYPEAGGVLPDGLPAGLGVTMGQNYFVHTVVSPTVIRLVSTLGGPVHLDFTGNGSGTLRCILPSFTPLPQFSVALVNAASDTITLSPNPPVDLANGDTVVFDYTGGNIPGIAGGGAYTVENYSVGPPRTFKITSGISARALAGGNTVTLTTAAPHGLAALATLDVTGVDRAFLNGSALTVVSAPTSTTLTYTITPLVATVTSVSRAATIATVVVGAHQLAMGDSVQVAGLTDATFNGTFVVASVSGSTSFTFVQAAQPDVGTTPDSGTVKLQTVTSGVSGGKLENFITGSLFLAVNVLRGFSFAQGENLKTVTLSLASEATLNGNHGVNLALNHVSPAPAALGSPATAILTIQDNDSVLGFDFDNFSVSESTLTASLRVSRLGSTAGSASVNYATVAETGAGKATVGVDYTATSGTLVFAAGDVQRTFTIPVANDQTPDEGTETVLVRLSNPVGAGLDTTQLPFEATLSITESLFSGGTFNFSAAAYSVNEDGGTVTVTVTRSAASAGRVDIRARTLPTGLIPGSVAIVNRTLNNGSATLTSSTAHSYLVNNPVVVVGLGAPFDGTFVITNVSGNQFSYASTTAVVQKRMASGTATLTTATAHGFAANDTIYVSIGDTSFDGPQTVAAGSSGTTLMFIVTPAPAEQNPAVSASGVVAKQVSALGTALAALTAGRATVMDATVTADYTPVDTSFIWLDGDLSSRSFSVAIANDLVVEGPETIQLALSLPIGFTPVSPVSFGAQSISYITIQDNESQVDLTASAFQLSESGGVKTISLRRTAGPVGVVSVDVTTADFAPGVGSATGGGVDYALVVQFTETAINASLDTITVTSHGLTNGAVVQFIGAPPNGVGAGPDFFVRELTANTFKLGASAGAGAAVDLQAPPGATPPTTYTLRIPNQTVTWASGDILQKTVLLYIADDTVVEPSESFQVTLGNFVGATAGSITTATVVIMDNDNDVDFVGLPYQVSETNGSVTITLARLRGTVGNIVLYYSTVDDTAEDEVTPAGVPDYSRIPSTLVVSGRSGNEIIVASGHGMRVGNTVVFEDGGGSGSLGSQVTLGTVAYTVSSVSADRFRISSGGTEVTLDGFSGTVNVRPAVVWTAGDTATKTFTVEIRDDTVIEGNQEFGVRIDRSTFSDPATIVGPNPAKVRILDNDFLGGGIDTSYALGVGVDNVVLATAVHSDVADANYRKVVAVGQFTTFNGVSRNRVVRLNADGTLDTSFLSGGTGANSLVNAVAIDYNQSPLLTANRGKVVIGGTFADVNGSARSRVTRLLADGTVDPGFTPPTNPPLSGTVQAVAVQPDGKVLVGGLFNHQSRLNLIRLNADGSFDGTFLSTGVGPNAEVRALVVQGDGKIVIGGDFTRVNTTDVNRVARLNSDGTVDASFNVTGGANAIVRALLLDVDNTGPLTTHLMIAGDFTAPSFGAAVTSKASDGSTVTLTTAGAHGISGTPVVTVSLGDAAFNGTYTLLTASGNTLTYTKSGTPVTSTPVSPVGLVSLQSQPANRVVRLTSAGAVDGTFRGNVGTGPNGGVNTLATYGSGANRRFLLGGAFTGVGFGVAVTHSEQVDASTVKLTTAVAHNLAVGNLVTVSGVNTTMDGTYTVVGPVIARSFQYARSGTPGAAVTLTTAGSAANAGVLHNRIAQLDNNGRVMTANNIPAVSFGTGFNNTVNSLSVQDVAGVNHYIAGGNFTSYNGVGGPGYDYLLRLVGTSLDQTFDNGTAADGAVNALAAAAGNKLLVAGAFNNLNGLPRGQIGRFNEDASLDTTFVPDALVNSGGSPTISALAVDNNNNAFLSVNVGKVVIGGLFTSVGGSPRGNVARLLPGGGLDTTFMSGLAGADAAVNAVAVQQVDGKVLIAGQFTTVNGTSRGRIARLLVDGSLDPNFMSGLAGANGPIYAMALDEADNHLYLAGDFSSVNNDTTQRKVARLNLTTGAVSAGFTPPTGIAPNASSVRALALEGLPGARTLLIGGLFTSLDAGVNPQRNVARLNSSGAALAFLGGASSGTDGAVLAIHVQPDGKIILGGAFNNAAGKARSRVARVDNGGVLDASINFGVGANADVNAILTQSDRRIILGGAFTTFNSQPAARLVRLQAGANDGSGTFYFAANTYFVNESGGSTDVTIVRSEGLLNTVTVNYSVVHGVGSTVASLTPSSALVFLDGDAIKTITVALLTADQSDAIPGADRSSVITIVSVAGGTAGTTMQSTTVTVRDDDSFIGFDSSTRSISEGAMTMTVNVRRIGGTAGIVTVPFMTRPLTGSGAATAASLGGPLTGTDYTATSGTLIFGDGVGLQSFTVTINEDVISEGDERFAIDLGTPARQAGQPVGVTPILALAGGSTFGSQTVHPSQTVTILDNETSPGSLGFENPTASVNESAVSYSVTVLRSGGRFGIVGATVAVTGGGAELGVDYEFKVSGVNTPLGTTTLSFADNVSTDMTVTLAPLADKLPEGNETIVLQISNPTGGATLAPGFTTLTVTIVDDDSVLQFATDAVSVSESAQNAIITVQRTGATSVSVSAILSTADELVPTARAGVHYAEVLPTALVFAIGENQKSFSVPIINNSLVEGTKSFKVRIDSVTGEATKGAISTLTVSIIDDDFRTLIAAGYAVVVEGYQPANNAADPGETVTMNFSIKNIGNVTSLDITATLEVSGGVLSPSGPQIYANLTSDATRTMPFTFTAAQVQTVTATLRLQDSKGPAGAVTFPIDLGVNSSFTNPTIINIPGTITVPSFGPASPYLNQIPVTGVSGLVSKVTVRLHGFSHTWPADVDMILVGPAGQKVVLMSDAGSGNSVANLNLTFDDAASSILPEQATILEGTFRPTDYVPGDSFPAPAPDGPYATTLSAFNGTSPNGVWTLYIVDDTDQHSGTILTGWSLNLSTVSPRINLAATMTSSATTVASLGQVTFTTTITNHGPNTATGVIYSNAVPAGFTFVSATSSVGSNPTVTAGRVFGTLGPLGTGAVHTVTVRFATSGSGVFMNTAAVFSTGEVELVPADNTASSSVAVGLFLTGQSSGSGNFSLTLANAVAGRTYVFEGTTDFLTPTANTVWTPVATSIATGSTLSVTIPAVGGFLRRFYRAIEQ